MNATGIAENMLDTAVLALQGENDWRSTLDQIDIPVYTTDCDGFVTYWNRACIEFAGREPELGRDRWCVTWKLYTLNGDPLPHEGCPMAEAVRTKSAVRDKIAIAMRPDGSRRAFKPYPTPLFSDGGEMTGAVNMLVDVSKEQSSALAEQANRCRRLSQTTTDTRASRILADMARDYAETAAALAAAR